MKTMIIFLLINVHLSGICQPGSKPAEGDPFLALVKKMHLTECLSYDARYRFKGLFELDTSVSYGRVELVKAGDSITFLHVVELKSGDEMVFTNDSAWFYRNQQDELLFLGTGIGETMGNHLQNYVPYNLITVDTLLLQVPSFWSTASTTSEHATVKVDIRDIPPEISRADFLVQIGLNDSLLYQVTEIAWFDSYNGGQFQEKTLTNHKQGAGLNFPLPSWLDAKRKETGMTDETAGGESIPVSDRMVIFPDRLKLHDLSGNPFLLPEDGLVFLDLWYAGCYPCMKSAPIVDSLYRDFSDRIYFLGVNETDRDTAKIIRYKTMMGLSFPVCLNRGEKIASLTGKSGYPAFILLDAATGEVLWSHTGYREDIGELIRRELLKNL
jgi:thiol-disulfide isomerase/thioredoxin